MAQRLAQGTHNPWVGSSNLSGPTNISAGQAIVWPAFCLTIFVRITGHYVFRRLTIAH